MQPVRAHVGANTNPERTAASGAPMLTIQVETIQVVSTVKKSYYTGRKATYHKKFVALITFSCLHFQISWL